MIPVICDEPLLPTVFYSGQTQYKKVKIITASVIFNINLLLITFLIMKSTIKPKTPKVRPIIIAVTPILLGSIIVLKSNINMTKFKRISKKENTNRTDKLFFKNFLILLYSF